MLRVLHYKKMCLCRYILFVCGERPLRGGLDLVFTTGALTACVLVAGRCGQRPSGCMRVLVRPSIGSRAVRKRATYRHTGIEVHAYTGIRTYTFTGMRVRR